jgi:hypothetical protein
MLGGDGRVARNHANDTLETNNWVIKLRARVRLRNAPDTAGARRLWLGRLSILQTHGLRPKSRKGISVAGTLLGSPTSLTPKGKLLPVRRDS